MTIYKPRTGGRQVRAGLFVHRQRQNPKQVKSSKQSEKEARGWEERNAARKAEAKKDREAIGIVYLWREREREREEKERKNRQKKEETKKRRNHEALSLPFVWRLNEVGEGAVLEEDGKDTGIYLNDIEEKEKGVQPKEIDRYRYKKRKSNRTW